MPKVTVVLCTKRMTPHFEWALESLNNQTFRDFEYIIIDGMHAQRKDAVKSLIESKAPSYPCMHIPDKPTRWRDKRPALCNARNTALTFAKGDYIVFHDDCCKMPANWLESHMKWLTMGFLVAGSWIGYQKEDPYGKGVVGPYGWEERTKLIHKAKTVSGGWLYGCNFSFPLKVALDINGFDEILDGEMGQDDVNFGIRAERKGYNIIYDPDCYSEYYMSDHGLLMNFDRDDNSSFWKGHPVEFKLEPVRRVLKDGKEHFSNEWMTEKLLEERERYLPDGNVFDLRDLRELARKNTIEKTYELMKGIIDPDPKDWRDGKMIEEKLKEGGN